MLFVSDSLFLAKGCLSSLIYCRNSFVKVSHRLLCDVAGGRQERHSVRYLRLSGRHAEQSCRLLRVLPVEHHWDLQVSPGHRPSLSGEHVSLTALTSGLAASHQVPVLHAGLHWQRVETVNMAEIQHLDPSVPTGGCGWRLVTSLSCVHKKKWWNKQNFTTVVSGCWQCFVLCMLPAVAVIQSLPIFDETRLFSLPLPAVLGHSLSFSYTLQVYLVLMFLGEASANTRNTLVSDSSSLSAKTTKYNHITTAGNDNIKGYFLITFRLLADLFFMVCCCLFLKNLQLFYLP